MRCTAARTFLSTETLKPCKTDAVFSLHAVLHLSPAPAIMPSLLPYHSLTGTPLTCFKVLPVFFYLKITMSAVLRSNAITKAGVTGDIYTTKQVKA